MGKKKYIRPVIETDDFSGPEILETSPDLRIIKQFGENDVDNFLITDPEEIF